VTNFFPFCTIGISTYQKRIYPILLFPLLSYPKLLPFWSVTDGRTTFFTPLYLSSFFFPLSARGPTRRRNSTGLAELWGGWPIELAATTEIETQIEKRPTESILLGKLEQS